MRPLHLALLPLVAIALAVGCSSKSTPAGNNAGGDDGGLVEAGADSGSLQTVSLSMQETVPANGEIFDCQYVQLPAAKEWLVAAKHDYTPGSHHLLLYTTDLTSIPEGGGQIQDCYEGGDAGNNIMSQARGVLYGGQTPTGGETYPQGVGLPANANEVLIFQVHYLNATAAALDAQVNVELTFDTNANDIQQQAGILFFYDPFIDVPAGATAKASMRCPITGDVTLLYASSHYHSRGVGYDAWNDTSPTQLATTPFYTSDSWSSPDNAQLTMPIKSGSLVRFECDYDNTAGTQAYFAGPERAEQRDVHVHRHRTTRRWGRSPTSACRAQDMFGTGTATCAATLSCLQACGGNLKIGGIRRSPPRTASRRAWSRAAPRRPGRSSRSRTA